MTATASGKADRPTPHPTDLELADWIDGKLHGTPTHGQIARHVIACHPCAGLVAQQGDAAYQLLRTSWRELHPW